MIENCGVIVRTGAFGQAVGTMLGQFSRQSGKSKSLHQPVGLMSPMTTLQLRGRIKKVHTAQLNKPLGVF